MPESVEVMMPRAFSWRARHALSTVLRFLLCAFAMMKFHTAPCSGDAWAMRKMHSESRDGVSPDCGKAHHFGACCESPLVVDYRHLSSPIAPNGLPHSHMSLSPSTGIPLASMPLLHVRFTCPCSDPIVIPGCPFRFSRPQNHAMSSTLMVARLIFRTSLGLTWAVWEEGGCVSLRGDAISAASYRKSCFRFVVARGAVLKGRHSATHLHGAFATCQCTFLVKFCFYDVSASRHARPAPNSSADLRLHSHSPSVDINNAVAELVFALLRCATTSQEPETELPAEEEALEAGLAEVTSLRWVFLGG